MLVIREKQVEILKQIDLERFENYLLESLARDYPKKYTELGKSETRLFIRRAIAKGTKHGIETEGGITALAEMMIQVGEHFENSPDQAYVNETLANSKLPGPLKIELIVSRIASRTQGRVVALQK